MNTWQIHQERFDARQLTIDETIYTIGNGYLGTRGTFEEGYPGAKEGSLLFGVFDAIELGKEELAAIPDWLPIGLAVNGERFRLDKGDLLHFQRTLDIQKGVLTRSIRWRSPQGIELTISVERFASLADEHLCAQRYSVTLEEHPHDAQVQIELWAAFNPAISNDGMMHWQVLDVGHEEDMLWLHTQTRQSQVQLVQAMSFTSTTPGISTGFEHMALAPAIRLLGTLSSGETLVAEKLVVMYTSRDISDPCRRALDHLQRLLTEGQHTHKGENRSDETPVASPYERLLAQHQTSWSQFWQVSDILIEGDERAQLAVRYNIYQLRISASISDSRGSIAAKGLTGFGYHGHVLHDTELFMLPFYSYVQPSIARNTLLYRYNLLPAARDKAKQNGYKGAQYPWESTLDGTEATPGLMPQDESGELAEVPNGKLELHVTADIAYAVWQYWRVSGDDDFLRDYGAEILLSTAQFWASRASVRTDSQLYEIRDVIGPDEWHTHVHNNFFTNALAQWNIRTALQSLDWLRKFAPVKAENLLRQLELTDDQLTQWQHIADSLFFPQDERKGLFEQFEGYFDLKTLDQEQYKDRTASYQVLLGIEELEHYRISKQADVLLLLTLLREQFSSQIKEVNWDYYLPLTDIEHGSSLTPAMHVMLACELDKIKQGYDLFLDGAMEDLENTRGDSTKGIHLGNCGAVWQAVVFGFAGLRITDDGYRTQPHWPEGWTRIAFTFQHRGQRVFVDLHR